MYLIVDELEIPISMCECEVFYSLYFNQFRDFVQISWNQVQDEGVLIYITRRKKRR